MKFRSNRFKVYVLFLSILFIPSTALSEAKDPENTVTLEEVIVTATRDREEIRRIPANVSVITAREIEQSGATSMVEVLEKLDSIQFRDYSGNSSQAYIDMRGIGGDNPYGKTLIMLDGRRLNNTDMRSINWLQIPLNNIERIEVVRGAGSVLYGDAAIGGVINIITKKGKGAPTFVAAVIAGSDGLHNERAGVTGSADKWSYALNGENKHSAGYRDRSKSSAQGGGFDVGYDASEFFRITMGASFNQNDYQFPGALTRAQMDQDRRQYQPASGPWSPAHSNDDEKDRFANVNLKMDSSFGSFGRFDAGFMYGYKDERMNMDSLSTWVDRTADTYAITPKYILERDIFGYANKATLGLDYYHEPFTLERYDSRERTLKTGWADLTRESLGVYIRDEFHLLKSLILSAGYRSERATIEGSNTDVSTPANSFRDQEKSYNAEAFEAGLTWLVARKSKVFTKYATVYRIPFLDEVASYYGFGGPRFLSGLEKEKGASLEAGTEFYPLNNLRIGLTLFRIDMEDEIQYVGVFPTGYNQNAGKTRHDGAEASFSWLWEKRARLYGNFTYHKATYEDGPYNKKELWLVPNWMANAGVEIYLPCNLTLRPEMRHVGDAFLSQDFNNVGEKLEDFTLFSLYLSYKPTFGKIKLTAFFGVENLTDEKYSSFGMYGAPWSANTYYPMPGVAFKGGLSLAF
jgi:iron complex outermembrane receptor protein